ncbi:MAG: hypothetical protein SO434_06165 [Eubacteriales bacterium]|nr:hypothetical protein [Eubacteriales bacterium]
MKKQIWGISLFIMVVLVLFPSFLWKRESSLPVNIAQCSSSYEDKIDRITLKDEIHEKDTQPDDPFVIRVPDQFRDSRFVLPTPDGWPFGKILIIEDRTAPQIEVGSIVELP